jgi:hypothetical protein
MVVADEQYFQRRAEAALRLARAAAHPAAASAHYLMAGHYLNLAKGGEVNLDTIGIVSGPSPLRTAAQADGLSQVATGMVNALRSTEDDAAQQKSADLLHRLAGKVRDPSLSARLHGLAAGFSTESPPSNDD